MWMFILGVVVTLAVLFGINQWQKRNRSRGEKLMEKFRNRRLGKHALVKKHNLQDLEDLSGFLNNKFNLSAVHDAILEIYKSKDVGWLVSWVSQRRDKIALIEKRVFALVEERVTEANISDAVNAFITSSNLRWNHNSDLRARVLNTLNDRDDLTADVLLPLYEKYMEGQLRDDHDLDSTPEERRDKVEKLIGAAADRFSTEKLLEIYEYTWYAMAGTQIVTQICENLNNEKYEGGRTETGDHIVRFMQSVSVIAPKCHKQQISNLVADLLPHIGTDPLIEALIKIAEKWSKLSPADRYRRRGCQDFIERALAVLEERDDLSKDDRRRLRYPLVQYGLPKPIRMKIDKLLDKPTAQPA